MATTPTYAKAIDGTIPGLTWDNFIKSFGSGDSAYGFGGNGESGGSGDTAGLTIGQANFDGLGAVSASKNAPTDPEWAQYEQTTGPNKANYFTQNATGGVDSHNNSIDTDSWLDKNLGPILYAAVGGVAGAQGLGFLGGAGDAALGAAQGAVNVGAGFAPSGLDAATTLGSGLASAAPAATSATNDIASPNYDPYSPSNWTADAGTTATDATNAATSTPSVWDQATNLAKQYGFGNGPIGSIQNIANGTGQLGDYVSAASTVNSAAGLANQFSGSSDSTNPFSSVVQQYANNALPTNGFGTYSNDQLGQLATTGDYSQPLANAVGNGLPTSGGTSNGGILGSLGNLISGQSLGTQDYSNLLGGAGSLLSGVLGYNTAQNGINAQTNAANNSNALAASIYGNNVALNAPFVKTGTTANNTLGDLYGTNGSAAQKTAYGNFNQSPNYQFALDQGTRAVQSSASAAGGLYSGRAAKDLENYGQGLASQQYNSYVGGLQNLSGTGQAAANQTAAQGNTYANNVTSNNAGIANAQTAGGLAGTNAITGSINGILGQNSNNQLLNYLLNKQGGSNGFYPT